MGRNMSPDQGEPAVTVTDSLGSVLEVGVVGAGSDDGIFETILRR